jgi:hypothetical protein
MDQTDLIRLASRINARTRDLEVLELCDAVLSTGQRNQRVSPTVTSVTTRSGTALPTCATTADGKARATDRRM